MILLHKPSGTSLCSSIKTIFTYKMLKYESHLHPKYIVTNISIKKTDELTVKRWPGPHSRHIAVNISVITS